MTQTQNNAGALLTLTNVTESSAQVSQTGDVNTGVGVQTATLSSTNTLTENGSSGSGQGFSLSQTTTDGGGRSQWSNSVNGEYLLYQSDAVSANLTDAGTNQTGGYSLSQGSSVSSMECESGNEVEGTYSLAHNTLTSYTLQQTDGSSPTAFTLTENGVDREAGVETGNAFTGGYSQSATSWDAFAMQQTGTDASGTAHNETVTGIEWVMQSASDNALSGAVSVQEGSELGYYRSRTLTTSGGSTQVIQDSGSLYGGEGNLGNLLTGSNTIGYGGDGNRYSLLDEFTNAGSSTTDVGGTVMLNLGSTPYTVSADLAGSGQGQAGTSGEGTTGAAGVGFNDGGGRLGRLRTGNGAVIDAVGSSNGGADALAQSASLGAELYKNYCFAAETPIRTPMGSKPIKEIKAGEWVLASPDDRPNGPVEAKVVEELFVNETHLWAVSVQGQKIRTSGEHPFYVLRKGWLKAAGLKEGDLLRSDDGQWVAVERVEETEDYETVYNFRVADWHTYFVGALDWGFSVWAHNTYDDLVKLLGNADPDRLAAATRLARSGGSLEQFEKALGADAPTSVATLRGAFLAAKMDGGNTPEGRQSAKDLALNAGMDGKVRRDAMDEMVAAKVIPPGLRGRGGSEPTKNQLLGLVDEFDKAGYKAINGPGSGKPEEANQRVRGSNDGSAPLDQTVQGPGGDKIRINTTTMEGPAGNLVPTQDEFDNARRAVQNLAKRGESEQFVVMIPKESNGQFYIVEKGKRAVAIPEQSVPELIQTLQGRGLIP
jgi:Pretoxin HINT domain